MKKSILLLCAAFLSLAGFCQEGGREFPASQVVDPYRVEVTFSKTVHILFPAAVQYVDLGSPDIIAGVVDGAENVLRVKAAVRGFEHETNFSVILSDGSFYSFNAIYSESPGQLNIELEDWLSRSPYADFANRRMYVRLQELGEELPVIVNRVMYTIHKKNRNDIKHIGSKRFGIEAMLRGIYFHNDLFYLHTSLANRSEVSYEVDYIRFKIVDKKVMKRTAIQETFIQPVRVFNDMVRVEGRRTERTVFAFRKISLPDDKVLVMEIYEKDGGRHQTITITNAELVGAKVMNDLKIL